MSIFDDFSGYPWSSMLTLIIMCISIGLIVLFYIVFTTSVDKDDCSVMDGLYPTLNSSISNNNSANSSATDLPLHNFFIKSAYNACSGGKYKNDKVDVCNLMAVIREGVRCLDFEIYSVDDQPVVATSTTDNYYVKETYDSVPFATVMSTIVDKAFATGTCPNSGDPLILHLRIKSKNQKIYSKMARIFQSYSSRMLGSDFNYNTTSNHLQTAPISALRNKIIIMVDKTNDDFLQNEEFMEFVNMVSNSMDMREYRFKDVKENDAELREFNMTHMTIVLPDKGSSPDNPDAEMCRKNGCQMVAMMFQRKDDQLQKSISYFNAMHSAFVLKNVSSTT